MPIAGLEFVLGALGGAAIGIADRLILEGVGVRRASEDF
jgi:hypothetical protein